MMYYCTQFCLFFLLLLSTSDAQDPLEPSSQPTSSPSSLPTLVATSSSPTLAQSQSPTTGPTSSFAPTTSFQPSNTFDIFTSSPIPGPAECVNHPDFFVEQWKYKDCQWELTILTCDDEQLGCFFNGNLGEALDYCCKCKDECGGICKDPVWNPTLPPNSQYDPKCYNGNGYENQHDDTGGIPAFVIVIIVVFVMAVTARVIYNCQGGRPERREVRQVMAARRQQQRENNTQVGPTEEERNTARYEKFVTKFYFQRVTTGMSNVTADSLRIAASKSDPEHPTSSDNEGAISAAGSRQNSSLSERLSSWRVPKATDECCICLEYYTQGETICAPITTECNHVFHEGCILEWLKTNERCPLCRVELLKD